MRLFCSFHKIHIKHKGAMFQISNECFPNQFFHPNKMSTILLGSTHWSRKLQRCSSTRHMLHHSDSIIDQLSPCYTNTYNTNPLEKITLWDYHKDFSPSYHPYREGYLLRSLNIPDTIPREGCDLCTLNGSIKRANNSVTPI